MNSAKLFDHFYDQYKVQVGEADYIYRRAAVWLSGNGLIATAIAALAVGDSGSRFGVDIAEPVAAVVGAVSTLCLLGAFVLLGIALRSRSYGRFSLPHEILQFQSMYRDDLERAQYPMEHREFAESNTVYVELCKVLAEKTKTNAEINEARHRLLGWSSMATTFALVGLVVLLAASALRTVRVSVGSDQSTQVDVAVTGN